MFVCQPLAGAGPRQCHGRAPDHGILPGHPHPTTGGSAVTLATVLTDYINACFIGLWVQTLEPDEAEREITRHALEQRWKLAVWDVANGIRLPAANGQPGLETGAGDPLAALRAVPALAEPDGTALLLLHNFHRFVNNPEVIQT